MKITFKPVEEIVILEEIRHTSPQELFNEMLAGTPPGAVGTAIWAEGIVFRHSALPTNVAPVAEERMKGKIYWDYVRYAEMPEYREKEEFVEKTVNIIKAHAPALVEAAKELKKRLKGGTHGSCD